MKSYQKLIVYPLIVASLAGFVGCGKTNPDHTTKENNNQSLEKIVEIQDNTLGFTYPELPRGKNPIDAEKIDDVLELYAHNISGSSRLYNKAIYGDVSGTSKLDGLLNYVKVFDGKGNLVLHMALQDDFDEVKKFRKMEVSSKGDIAKDEGGVYLILRSSDYGRKLQDNFDLLKKTHSSKP